MRFPVGLDSHNVLVVIDHLVMCVR